MTAAVIRHNIDGTWETIICWYISVWSLVKSLQAEETRCWTRVRYHAFVLTENRCCVVRKVLNGGFPGIHLRDQDFVMGHTHSEFQVTVGDGTVEVGIGY
jgi:hypothetical protein